MTTALETTVAPPATRARAPETVVAIRGLTKRFPIRRGWTQTLRHPFHRDVTTALHGIDCDVHRGEFFGLLGANGAGKTTLFKILATLILPDEGTARVEDWDAVRHGARVRSIVAPVIADERSLHWRLSAFENLRLFAVLHGVRPAALARRIAEILDIVGIADAGSKSVGAFSSGMKQRLLIARALIAAPRVLLLDEPTRSLDPVAARDFRAFLRREITGRLGCTVLLATHNTEEALDLCDRVAILSRGKLVATGTPAALKEEFGDERYRLWTKGADRSTFAALAAQGLVRTDRVTSDAGLGGWSVVELNIPGGPTRVAGVLESLVGQGVAVARCERVDLSLADLIERVLQRA